MCIRDRIRDQRSEISQRLKTKGYRLKAKGQRLKAKEVRGHFEASFASAPYAGSHDFFNVFLRALVEGPCAPIIYKVTEINQITRPVPRPIAVRRHFEARFASAPYAGSHDFRLKAKG